MAFRLHFWWSNPIVSTLVRHFERVGTRHKQNFPCPVFFLGITCFPQPMLKTFFSFYLTGHWEMFLISEKYFWWQSTRRSTCRSEYTFHIYEYPESINVFRARQTSHLYFCRAKTTTCESRTGAPANAQRKLGLIYWKSEILKTNRRQRKRRWTPLEHKNILETRR